MSARVFPSPAHRFTLSILVASFLALTATTPGSAQAPQQSRYVPDQVIVQYKPQARSYGLQTISRRVRATLHSTVRLPRTYVYQVEGMSVPEAVAALRQDPDVAFAEPNYYAALDALPNDSLFDQQWALHNTGQDLPPYPDGPPGVDIGTERAWDFTTGDSSLIVAVLDNGFYIEHEDLAGNLLPGWDFSMNDDDVTPASGTDRWHGSHVAGIVGAVGNNGIGVSGVAWRVKILPCKVIDGGTGTVSGIVNAVDYAITSGARVINASFHLLTNNADSSLAFREAIERADEAGVIFVTAAGNNKFNIDEHAWYPASYDLPNMVTVAASDRSDDPWNDPFLTAFGTNYGPLTVDLAAPGVRIFSTMSDNNHPGDKYGAQTGTSMASPMVAGAFALLLSHAPGLTAYEAIARLLEFTDHIEAWEGLTSTEGRLNIGRAIIGVDSLPPDAVTLGHATITSDAADLYWWAPADGGYTQQAETYDLRYSTSSINESNWASATPIVGLPNPEAAGTLQTMHVDGLAPLHQYYFALKSTDEAGNRSALSNVVAITTLGPDISAPASVAFGNVPEGTSQTKTAKIKNTGTDTLDVSAVDLTAYFTWAGPGSSFAPFSIPPGDSVTCTLRFTPEFQGFHYGTFTIISNDPDANEDTVTVNLQGKGFGYQYAAVSVGAPQEIVIKNDRQTDLHWRLIGARTEQPPVVGYTLSDASPPAVTKLAEGATSGKDALRFLSNARIAYAGKATTLTRDLQARGATLVQFNRPIESIAGYNVLWISSEAPLKSEEREVVASWVRDGGALMLEGAVPFETGVSAEAVVGGGLLQVSSEGTNRFGEWLEYGAGDIVRVEPGTIGDSELEQRSQRLAANQALDWLIPADWLSFQTVAGVTNPGATSKVGVRPGQLTLPNGDYVFEVMAFTNNPEQPRITIPVQFAFGPREDLSRPTIHALRQSAPNPMTTSTRIAFDLPLEEHVRLEVFDVNGRSVRTLVDGAMPAGRHQVEWGARGANGNRVSAGVYFYRIKTPSYNAVKKLVVTE